MSSTNHSRRHRHGHSLLELVVAVSIASILALGMTSTLGVAMNMFPTGAGSAAESLSATRILDVLTTELEQAVYITEHSTTALGFSVPDRNGDGLCERIRYAWSSPNGAITRQYNGGTVVTLASGVQQFSFNPTLRNVTEAFPTLGVEEPTETLLIDYNGASGLGNLNITSNSWGGQYFQGAFPAGVTAWRPTRVRFMAKIGSVNGSMNVQMRPADPNLKPTAQVLDTQVLSSGGLTSTYAWQDLALGKLDPIGPAGSICLVLQYKGGTTACTVEQCSDFAGLLKAGSGGTNWSHDTGKSLISQLYGKRTMSDGTQQYINTNYLMTADFTLQMTSSSPVLRTTATLLNHPELLSGLWELKFDQDPTKLDVNGDGLGDWAVRGGGVFDATTSVGGVWKTSAVQINTSSGNDFIKPTVVDLRMRNTSVGGNGAIFTLNAFRSSGKCAPLMAYLKLQSDGTQVLTVSGKLDDATPATILNVANLPSTAVDVHLIVDPTSKAVSITVNNVQQGTFSLNQYISTDTSRIATLGADVSNAEISYARIRVLE